MSMPKKLTPYKVAETWGQLYLILAMGKAQELLDALNRHETALVIEKGKAKM